MLVDSLPKDSAHRPFTYSELPRNLTIAETLFPQLENSLPVEVLLWSPRVNPRKTWCGRGTISAFFTNTGVASRMGPWARQWASRISTPPANFGAFREHHAGDRRSRSARPCVVRMASLGAYAVRRRIAATPRSTSRCGSQGGGCRVWHLYNGGVGLLGWAVLTSRERSQL